MNNFWKRQFMTLILVLIFLTVIFIVYKVDCGLYLNALIGGSIGYASNTIAQEFFP